MFSSIKLRFLPWRLRQTQASRSASRPRPGRKRVRPTLEQLEDRLTPSTLTVTNLNDDGSAGSLRAVLATANTDAANGSSDTINFDPSLAGGTIVLTQGQLELSGIAGKITIDGSGLSTPVAISGNNASRVFQVDSGVQSEVDGLTITGGAVGSPTGGGAIQNFGTLTIDSSTFSDNTAAGNGGAIFSTGPLTVSNSTFTDNSAGNYGGGAISMVFSGTSDLAVSNCTFSGNTADGGGAILDWGAGSLTVAQCDFSDNTGGTGGAIDCLDPLTSITGSTFHANSATTAGAVYCNGQTSIDGSSFDQNSPGAIYEDSGGHLTVTNSTFTDNNTAIFTTDWSHNGTSLQVSNCAFSGNTDSAGLPPFYVPGAVRVGLTVTDVSSTRHSATESGRGHISPNSAGVRYPSEL